MDLKWLSEGVRFMVKDRLGNKYEYTYKGVENTDNGYNIHLFNETTATDTYVEEKWFEHREITIIS